MLKNLQLVKIAKEIVMVTFYNFSIGACNGDLKDTFMSVIHIYTKNIEIAWWGKQASKGVSIFKFITVSYRREIVKNCDSHHF